MLTSPRPHARLARADWDLRFSRNTSSSFTSSVYKWQVDLGMPPGAARKYWSGQMRAERLEQTHHLQRKQAQMLQQSLRCSSALVARLVGAQASSISTFVGRLRESGAPA